MKGLFDESADCQKCQTWVTMHKITSIITTETTHTHTKARGTSFEQSQD